MDVVSLTQKLIHCPSVTPNDAGCLDLIDTLLKLLDFTCIRLPCQDVDNLFAYRGGEKDLFCFAGHVDVVPPGPGWSFYPFSGTVKDNKIYGRGAVDMKGAIASFLSALYESETQAPVGLLLTSDEEGPALHGTRFVVDWLKEKKFTFKGCLVGEPTSISELGNIIKIGRKGSFNAQITVKGKQGHVAFPQFSRNPIGPLLHCISSLLEIPLDCGYQHFEPSRLEITALQTDTDVCNMVPGQAKACLNIRFTPHYTGEQLEIFLSETLKKTKNLYGDTYSWNLETDPNSEPSWCESGYMTDIMTQAIQQTLNITPQLTTCGGTSDARFIQDLCPVIEFGLLGDQAHQTDEYVSIQDLNQLTEIYKKLLTLI